MLLLTFGVHVVHPEEVWHATPLAEVAVLQVGYVGHLGGRQHEGVLVGVLPAPLDVPLSQELQAPLEVCLLPAGHTGEVGQQLEETLPLHVQEWAGLSPACSGAPSGMVQK